MILHFDMSEVVVNADPADVAVLRGGRLRLQNVLCLLRALLLIGCGLLDLIIIIKYLSTIRITSESDLVQGENKGGGKAVTIVVEDWDDLYRPFL